MAALDFFFHPLAGLCFPRTGCWPRTTIPRISANKYTDETARKRANGSLCVHSSLGYDFYRVHLAYQLLFSSPCPGRFCSVTVGKYIYELAAFEDAISPFSIPLDSIKPTATRRAAASRGSQ